MKSKYFKEIIPANHLFGLLQRICKIEHNEFILNYCSYKSAIFYDLISPFMEICLPYYLSNKQSYVTKPLTYKSFLTVVRHICKTNGIFYRHQIKYNKSEYEIVYYIHLSSSATNVSTQEITPTNLETNPGDDPEPASNANLFLGTSCPK